MNISNSQVNRLRHFVRAGLRSLFRPEPQTAVEWADANYYLPKESAYQEGRWETLPFQRAIMNAMGSDYIREVNVVKSARVGYSKMLLGVYAYFIEHKQRNTLIWLPTDGDAENFMKTHVEPTIRDIPSLLALAPWYGKKHRDNTLTMKRFTNGRGFWCLGGKAAKNYREKSVDVAGYDELAAFDEDIEQEGSPTFLGDKRIEGSVWPKSIRGSTPKVRGTCQIERAASESPHFMRFHVACPHCGEEQYLKFGDKETSFGLKWTPDARRGSNSELETAVKDLGEAVSYKGMYGDTAIVVYSGQYVENDVKKNFLPDNTMVLGNTQARGLRTYGCIQDADAQREGINASARYPKNWVTAVSGWSARPGRRKPHTASRNWRQGTTG